MKNSKLRPYVLLVFALLLIITATILFTSRKEKGEAELPFETIEMAEIPGTGYEYQGREPTLVIVAEIGDISKLGSSVSTKSQSSLESLNFSDYFAVAAFQGLKDTTMYGVEIQRILRKGNAITIYVHFTERDPSVGAGAIITSPYHIVKIPRQGLNGKMEFILYADSKEVTRQTYIMP